MRPLELKLRNFRSYFGEHEFDFRDRTLIGIVGPIGSGKSSLLDAMAFALYGRTPQIGSATKTLINQRAADAAVSLRFEVEGNVWEAVRSIRLKGQSKHALYRYEADVAEAVPVEKHMMEGEVNSLTEQLLGLDFAAFERSVLLAQGRFAEFLQARPAERDKVLKGVFGHDRIDRMKELAREHRDSAEKELEKLVGRLERLEEIRAEQADRKVRLQAALQRQQRLQDAGRELAELDAAIEQVSASLSKAQERLHGLEEHAERLPDPAATERALTDATAAESRRSELASELDKAQRRLSTTEAALAEATAAGELEKIQRAARLLAAAEPQLKAVIEADRRIASFRERQQAAESDIASAISAAADAERVRDESLGRAAEAAKILEEAESALDVGRHADMAATLRGRLIEDEKCPVCAQPVHEMPDQAAASHLDELEAVVADARSTKQRVDDDHTAALAVLERTKEQLVAAKEKQAAAANQVAGAEEDAIRVRGDFEETTMQLEKILGPGDPGPALEVRQKRYEQLVTDRDEAQRKVDQVRGLHDQAIRDEQQSAKALQETGVRLTEMATRLGIALTIGDEVDSVRRAFDEVRAAWAKETADLRDEYDDGTKQLEQKQKKRQQRLRELEIDGEYSAAVAVVADRIHSLERELETGTVQLENAVDLDSAREKLVDEIEVFGRISRDLTDSRFIRFLLDEERARLAELGSDHFQLLSAGRYEFADDQFGIVDLVAADATRRADSLSGGETFLASLGLALALAEMVAGTGGRLDSFFLDEGFGTLDPEHLDLAMQGIERLVSQDQNRLVVIVSHVPELRMRLEDLIELDRNPVTGDTKVLRH
jgi:exonuclease SbcC